MRNITLKHWVLAGLFLLMPWVADAAGLGRLIVLSSLGQPLIAEIDLVSVRSEELSSLSVRLAPPDTYKQANLQYGPALIGLRLSVEKRAGGQAYVKVTTTRPVQEPFLDLLIELNWASGRITREYTALLDPPGYGSAMAEIAPPAAAPAARPAPAPAVAAAPARQAVAAPAASAKEYGPVKRGDTLGGIAAGLKPEGVTLEQMLVGLYRSNPDAFINNNLNLIRSGKILRVPEREELSAVPQQEAVKEYRAQVSDWNAYRRKLADSASGAPESTATAGKITPRVVDKAADAGAKDVVRLSKGEPPGGAAVSGTSSTDDRLRALEEETVARGKALKEANERIALLEKTISDQQRLLELKSQGMAAAQQLAKPAAGPAVTPKPASEAGKDEPKAVASAEKAAAGAKPAQPKAAPEQKPQPKAVPKPPPQPEPGLIDTLLGEPLYLAAGGGVILLAGLGFWMSRRRSKPAQDDDGGEKPEPAIGEVVAEPPSAKAGAAAAVTAAAAVASGSAVAAAGSAAYDVDPLAEAEVYIAYGRDGQAEEILKEALAKDPDHEKAQLKLLEIYAARKDTVAFDKLATGFNKLTQGQGDDWQKVLAMGYALSPDNPFYADGKDMPVAADLDFDLDASGASGTTTDILLDAAAVQEASGESTTTEMMEPGAMQAMVDAAADQGAESASGVPAAGKGTQADDKPDDSGAIDFNFELPDADKSTPASGADEPQGKEDKLDFKLDLPDISLDLDGKDAAPVPDGGAKDAHWHDVQTKFDLAKAYQEMGENNDAKTILQEVIKEGDAQQQAEAKAILSKLG